MLRNGDRGNRDFKKCAECELITRWLDDLAGDYESGQGLGLHHARWDG
jgi:hypothetical protein